MNVNWTMEISFTDLWNKLRALSGKRIDVLHCTWELDDESSRRGPACIDNLQIDVRPSSEGISARTAGSRRHSCLHTVTELSPCCRHSLIAFLPPSRLDNVHSYTPWPLPPSWWTICPCWLLYIYHFSSCHCQFFFFLLISGSCSKCVVVPLLVPWYWPWDCWGTAL